MHPRRASELPDPGAIALHRIGRDRQRGGAGAMVRLLRREGVIRTRILSQVSEGVQSERKCCDTQTYTPPQALPLTRGPLDAQR